MVKFIVFLFTICLSITSYASFYEFNGQKIKLNPFIDTVPNKKVRLTYLKTAPDNMILKSTQTEVKNQGGRGSCAHFAAAGMFESLIKKRMAVDVNISEEFLIYFTKAELNLSSFTEASSLIKNLLTFAKYGFLLEKDAPYQPSFFGEGLPCEQYKGEADSGKAKLFCYSHFSPPKKVLGGIIKGFDLSISKISNTSSAIVNHLSTKKTPVGVSLPVNHKGWDANTGYVYYDKELRKECLLDESKCGGHAVIIVGFDLSKEIFYFKNSWGKKWGDAGYGTLPFSYINLYSYNRTVVGTLESEVLLPADYAEESTLSISDFSYTIDLYQKEISTSINSRISYLANNVLYMSSFLGFSSDNSLQAGDKNWQVFMLPEEYHKSVGYYFAARFFHFLESENISFDTNDPAVMRLPSMSLLPEKSIQDKKLFLRLSIYHHNDQGWNIALRRYVPVQREGLDINI